MEQTDFPLQVSTDPATSPCPAHGRDQRSWTSWAGSMSPPNSTNVLRSVVSDDFSLCPSPSSFVADVQFLLEHPDARLLHHLLVLGHRPFGMRAPLPYLICLAMLLLSCPAPPGQFCGSGSECPVSSYCLGNQCLMPSTVSQNLSVVVTPTDPALAVQQFLPDQYQTVDGFSTIVLDQPQVLSGQVTLPANCSDAGYPGPLSSSTGPTIDTRSLPNSFAFDTDGNGYLAAELPIGNYAERVSTAVASAAAADQRGCRDHGQRPIW